MRWLPIDRMIGKRREAWHVWRSLPWRSEFDVDIHQKGRGGGGEMCTPGFWLPLISGGALDGRGLGKGGGEGGGNFALCEADLVVGGGGG